MTHMDTIENMEKFKTFEEMAEESATWIPSKEFMEGFQKFMEESVRHSRINEAEAIRSAFETIIF